MGRALKESIEYAMPGDPAVSALFQKDGGHRVSGLDSIRLRCSNCTTCPTPQACELPIDRSSLLQRIWRAVWDWL